MTALSPQSVHGVLLLDKQEGQTSFDVVRRVRSILKVKKVGHAGTLDPFATGLLPICVGESTKSVQHLVDGTKTYDASLRLGQETDTLDREGEIIAEHAWNHISMDAILDAVVPLVGEIEQVPPRYSALKIEGKRLYKYARAGEVVDIPSRLVRVDSLDVLEQEGPHVKIRVVCGKGTYIRALARDLGRALGCGAHLSTLRRTRIGSLDVVDAVQVPEQGSPAHLLGPLMDSRNALAHVPEVHLDETLAARVRYGQRIPVLDLQTSVCAGPLRALGPDGELLALVCEKEGCLHVIRGFVTPW